MGKKNKSKRFMQQSKDSVAKHDEQFPYRMTYSEAEAQNISTSNEIDIDVTLGGF